MAITKFLYHCWTLEDREKSVPAPSRKRKKSKKSEEYFRVEIREIVIQPMDLWTGQWQ